MRGILVCVLLVGCAAGPADETIDCAMLGGSWSGGVATRRGSIWDTSACALAMPGSFETVKPAERDAAKWGTARCNDGTPFTFYVSLAPAPSSDWVIHLQGGVYCDDATMLCADRDRALTTAGKEADRALGAIMAGGIVSRDPTVNPSFAGANIVFAH